MLMQGAVTGISDIKYTIYPIPGNAFCLSLRFCTGAEKTAYAYAEQTAKPATDDALPFFRKQMLNGTSNRGKSALSCPSTKGLFSSLQHNKLGVGGHCISI